MDGETKLARARSRCLRCSLLQPLAQLPEVHQFKTNRISEPSTNAGVEASKARAKGSRTDRGAPAHLKSLSLDATCMMAMAGLCEREKSPRKQAGEPQFRRSHQNSPFPRSTTALHSSFSFNQR